MPRQLREMNSRIAAQFCANRHESTDVFLREEAHHHTSITDKLKLVHLSWVRNILKMNTGRSKIYSFLKKE